MSLLLSGQKLEPTLIRSDFADRIRDFAGGDLSAGVSQQRSQSYDHCYNYFVTTPDPTEDMEKSCAILGFYLASWGMYRGSSYLFRETNSSHLRPVITFIASRGPALRTIDVDSYNASSMKEVWDAFRELRNLVLPGGQTYLTLVTKIMVAVFGCVPAHDTYFIRGMKLIFQGRARSSFWHMTTHTLELLSEFYDANSQVIDDLAASSKSFNFGDETPQGLPLTKAKIIDMYGFDLGFNPRTATEGDA